MLKKTTAIDLTQNLFQLLKRIPHMRLNVQGIPGLTNSEHELLVILKFNITEDKKMLSASEITNLLHITPAGGTHLFKPLEQAGYITRVQDSKDRRITLIGLTDKGMETTNTLLADIQGQINGLINYLGEADSRAFIRLLTKVFDYLSLVDESENDKPATKIDYKGA